MKRLFTKVKNFLIIPLVILTAWYVSKYWIQIALIQGDSMLPAYHNGQLVLVSKYQKEYNIGDVILFRHPSLSAPIIKRIIAVPNDTIQIREGIVYVNNTPSSLIPAGQTLSYSGIANAAITLSENQYFVLGDNYTQSKDSRYPEIGCIPYSSILGKVLP